MGDIIMAPMAAVVANWKKLNFIALIEGGTGSITTSSVCSFFISLGAGSYQ